MFIQSNDVVPPTELGCEPLLRATLVPYTKLFGYCKQNVTLISISRYYINDLHLQIVKTI